MYSLVYLLSDHLQFDLMMTPMKPPYWNQTSERWDGSTGAVLHGDYDMGFAFTYGHMYTKLNPANPVPDVIIIPTPYEEDVPPPW